MSATAISILAKIEGRMMGLTAMPIYNITKDTNVTELEDTMHSDNWMMRGFFCARRPRRVLQRRSLHC